MKGYASKAVIIGAGNVGATIAYTLAIQMAVEEIVLIDHNKDKALGEVLDLKHGHGYYESVAVSAGDYEDCKDANYIIVTAGAKQDKGETRLDLTAKNKKIVKEILKETLKYNKTAFYIFVSNPVDILTYEAIKFSGLPRERVFGSGTSLDTSRFKYHLGKYFDVSPSNVHAYIIGEHGDSSLPVLSHANIVGIPIDCYEGYSQEKIQEIYQETKNAAYDVINKKGATYYAIALVVNEIVRSIEYDQRRIIPVSTLLKGEYGYKDISLGVPCIIGKNGIEKIVEFELNTEEKEQLEKCVENLKQYI